MPLQYIGLRYRYLYYKSFAFAGDLRKSRNFNIFVGLANSCSVTSYLRCKVSAFNHICKSFARFLIKKSNLSSSTSLSSSDSLKWGQDNTPIVSASLYTRLNKAPLSIGEAGRDSGRIVSKRQPQPEHSGVRRHQSALERNRQQSFMFERIFDSSKDEVLIILL